MIAALLAFAAIQVAPAQPSDADALAAAMPALRLGNDARMATIFRGYFACYTDHIAKDPSADLSDDSRTSAMMTSAYRTCTPSREKADAEALAYLATLSTPNGKVTVERYRRIMGWAALSKLFAVRSKLDAYNAYLGRLYRGETFIPKAN